MRSPLPRCADIGSPTVIRPSGAPAKSPSKPQKASSPDSLGARRVIPVPKAVALQQQHRLLAVDGQATLLDAAPGIYPRPLLLVLHGMGESALTMRQQTGFTALAALDGFDVAYPDAPEDPAITTSAAVFVRPQSVVAEPRRRRRHDRRDPNAHGRPVRRLHRHRRALPPRPRTQLRPRRNRRTRLLRPPSRTSRHHPQGPARARRPRRRNAPHPSSPGGAPGTPASAALWRCAMTSDIWSTW